MRNFLIILLLASCVSGQRLLNWPNDTIKVRSINGIVYVSSNAQLNQFKNSAKPITVVITDTITLTAHDTLSANCDITFANKGYIKGAYNFVIGKASNFPSKHIIDTSVSPYFPLGLEVNPVWIGAVGDSTNSAINKAAFNKAIQGLSSQGGTLFIPDASKCYLITSDNTNESVTLKSNVTIRGESWKAKFFVVANGGSTKGVFGHDINTALSNVTIENIAIDGNKANQGTCQVGKGIVVNGSDVRISNCNIINTYQSCIYHGGADTTSKNIIIENNVLKDPSNASPANYWGHIAITGGKQILIRNNLCYCTDAAANYAIDLEPNNGYVIDGAKIHDNYCLGGGVICSKTTGIIRNIEIHDNFCNIKEPNIGGTGQPDAIKCTSVDSMINIYSNTIFPVTQGGGIVINTITGTTKTFIKDNRIYINQTGSYSGHHGIILDSVNGGVCVVDNNLIVARSQVSATCAIRENKTNTNINYGINTAVNFDTVYNVKTRPTKINEILQNTEIRSMTANGYALTLKANSAGAWSTQGINIISGDGSTKRYGTIFFSDSARRIWQIGKNTDNEFHIYYDTDSTNREDLNISKAGLSKFTKIKSKDSLTVGLTSKVIIDTIGGFTSSLKAKFTDSTRTPTIRDANGKYWRIKVSAAGVLSADSTGQN